MSTSPVSVRTSAAAACAALALVALAACGGGGTEPSAAVARQVQHVDATPPAKGPLPEATWLISKEPVTLDLDNDGATSQSDIVMSNVCERLVQVQPDLSTKPYLAKSYTWTNPKTLVFTLREDVTFHDGSPMTADDVVWSLRRHAAEDAAEADEYVNVTSIEKTGNYEVTVHLSQPDAVFLKALAGDAGVVLQRKAVEAQGERYGTPDGADACSGPMVLDSWRSGKEIVLTKAPNYWNPDRAAKTDRMTIRWAEDDAIVNSLVTGEATGAYLETIASAARLVDDPNLTISQGPDTRVWSMMVTERGGLTDPRLRRALSLALDREGVSKAAFAGLVEPAKEPVGPGAWGYERDRFEAANKELTGLPASPSTEDLDKAKKLVAEVGQTKPIVVATDGSSIRNVIASAFVDAAKKIGLKASLTQIPTQQYGDYYSDPAARQKADLFADDYFISKNDPVGFYKNGASDSSVQWTFDDPAYDRLVSQGRAALDDGKRADVAIELAARWAEAMPWIPVVQSPTTLVMSNEVTGVPASGAYRYYPWAADLGSAS